jgi:DNA polymerase gamma 1
VFNYGRIYGAGVTFAVKLLMQFNPEMSEQEAKTKAKELYKSTKGYKSKPAQVKQKNGKSENVELLKQKWKDGSESEMFNKLEEIARSESPKTPVLEARITETLEPQNVNDDVI